MQIAAGTAWPSREALTRVGVPRVRTALDIALWAGMALWLVASAYTADVFHGWSVVLPVLGLLCFVAAVVALRRWAVARRLLPRWRCSR